MPQFDLTLNATLDVDDQTWADLLETLGGNEDAALQELSDDLEGLSIDSYLGSAWIAWVDDINRI